MTTLRNDENINVLLVEDDEDDFVIISDAIAGDKAFRDMNFNLSWSETLKDTSDKLGQNNIDIILLDLALPDAQGLDLVKSVKELANDVPIIVLSGLDDEEIARQAIDEGAQDYIIKGEFDEEHLRRAIVYARERAYKIKELKEAQHTAQEAAKAKSEFLANMSHEIRTPLTAIIGYAEAIQNSQLSNEEKTTALGSILRNGNHLLEVINDILDISKVEAGKLDLEIVECSAVQILHDIEATFSLKAEEKDLFFRLDYEFPIPAIIKCDPTRLRQILFNLVGNAIKFTKEGGIQLITSYDKKENKISFEVIDSGIGISKENQSKLFQAFSQGDTATTREFGGTGLGLVISQQLAAKLGGTIELESEEYKGSTFRVTLPAGNITGCDWLSSSEQIKNYLTDLNDTTQPTPDLDGSVLIADDCEDNRNLMTLLIKKAGVSRIEYAENGEEAVEKAIEHDFDLILMDMHMPKMDGFEASTEIRNNSITTPIIACTASVLSARLNECTSAGCNGYIRKPFTQQEFYSVLSTYLNEKSSLEGSPLYSKLLNQDKAILPIVLSFLNNLPGRVDNLKQFLKDKDIENAREINHKLLSSGLFGYPQITDICEEISTELANDNFDKAYDLSLELAKMAARATAGKDKLQQLIEN